MSSQDSATAECFQRRWRQALRQAQLLLVYREESTLALMKQQVRKALLLPPGQLPDWLNMVEAPITDPMLLLEYEKYDANLHDGTKQDHYARQHNRKRQAWKVFLQEHLQDDRLGSVDGQRSQSSAATRWATAKKDKAVLS